MAPKYWTPNNHHPKPLTKACSLNSGIRLWGSVGSAQPLSQMPWRLLLWCGKWQRFWRKVHWACSVQNSIDFTSSKEGWWVSPTCASSQCCHCDSHLGHFPLCRSACRFLHAWTIGWSCASTWEQEVLDETTVLTRASQFWTHGEVSTVHLMMHSALLLPKEWMTFLAAF